MVIRIWVDCDDVLSETVNELLKRSPLKEKWIQRLDITSYYLSDVKKIGIRLEEAINIFNSFFESPEYFQTEPASWAYEKLYERKQAWHTLFVVTARSKPYENRTRRRVETHFPWIFSDFLFMNQYTENEILKSKLCKKKWIQVLIDDNLSNILDMNKIWLPCFLLDKPWNQWIDNSELLHRVYSRDEIDLSKFFNFKNAKFK